jgi:hypothetical protein
VTKPRIAKQTRQRNKVAVGNDSSIVTDEYLSGCQKKIESMLARSQTKVIFPILTLGLLRAYIATGKDTFSDSEIRRLYEETVRGFKKLLGHDLHIGGKYYDAYPSRNLPRYKVVIALGDAKYQLEKPYCQEAQKLIEWIPDRIQRHIANKLDIIPRLGTRSFRVAISDEQPQFSKLIRDNIDRSPTNFEIFCFAILKVHLEKFACRVYRDTRTSAHDHGVDISTNFGVVYQIKKLKVVNRQAAEAICAELKANFDSARLDDGKVILVIDDIADSVKSFLVNMKVQSIRKADLLKLAEQIEESEDREKVLRIVYDEFRREYSSNIA